MCVCREVLDGLLLARAGWPVYQHVHAHEPAPSTAALSPRASDGNQPPAPLNPLAMCDLSTSLCRALGYDTVLNGSYQDCRWVTSSHSHDKLVC